MGFNNGPRFYAIEGIGRLPSVTTILDVIAKPALYGWYAKKGAAKAREIMEWLQGRAPALYDELIVKLPPDFMKSGAELAEQAADYGGMAHQIIERRIRGEGVVLDGLPDPVLNAIGTFDKWWAGEKFRPIKAECLVYSKKLLYAGTCDAICNSPEGVTLLDWKTSKGIWPEYHLQAVAYKYAAEELSNEFIPNVKICRFGKDGSFETYTVPQDQHGDLFEVFLDAKKVWTWWINHQRNSRGVSVGGTGGKSVPPVRGLPEAGKKDVVEAQGSGAIRKRENLPVWDGNPV